MDPIECQPGVCQICKREFTLDDLHPSGALRPSLVDMIEKRVPDWDHTGFICQTDLDIFRRDYIKHCLEEELGELSTLENEVIESLREREVLSENISKEFDKELTYGERLSDKIAEFGGSWKFLILFFMIMLVWIVLNSIFLASKAFDPFPYILMNLILSCLAAVQAPVIMMSQNRSESRDRLRSENDYKINLKAELEIRHLHEKMDHLLRRQYNRLFETQQIQIDLLHELARQKNRQ